MENIAFSLFLELKYLNSENKFDLNLFRNTSIYNKTHRSFLENDCMAQFFIQKLIFEMLQSALNRTHISGIGK